MVTFLDRLRGAPPAFDPERFVYEYVPDVDGAVAVVDVLLETKEPTLRRGPFTHERLRFEARIRRHVKRFWREVQVPAIWKEINRELRKAGIKELRLAEKVVRKRGGQWCVFSESSGRSLGCYPTQRRALARLSQIQRFKKVTALWRSVAYKAVGDFLNDEKFWSGLGNTFVQSSQEITEDIMQRVSAMGETHMGLAVDFDLADGFVMAETQTLTNTWWAAQKKVDQKLLREALAAHVAVPDRKLLESRVSNIFGQRRARTIARTETTRMFAEGNLASYKATPGIKQVEWQTVSDSLVDPICTALQGKRWNLRKAQKPPAHPNCLIGSVMVQSLSGVVATTERWYEGPVVIIRTHEGHDLTVTPNHPILTPNGWVPAGQLHKGGYVISRQRREWIAALGDPDDQYMPARIEQVAGALRIANNVSSGEVEVAALDFHGDGSGSKVATIRSRPSGSPIMNDNIDFQQSLTNSPAVASITLGKGVLRFPFEVTYDQVVSVDVRSSWFGYVYNMETVWGWYVGNGVIVHNCRCWLAPVVAGTTEAIVDNVLISGEVAPLIRAAKQAEPLISTAVRRTAKSNKGKLRGLQHRLKTEASLRRKLQRRFHGDGIPVDQIKQESFDALRYTMVLEEGVYTSSVKGALAGFRARGMDIVNLRNLWSTDRYKGIHVVLRTPEGQLFEVQFHTPASLKVKRRFGAPLYEQLRELPKGFSAEAEALQQRLEGHWSTVGVPRNAETISAAG